MKPKPVLRFFLALAGSSVLAVSLSSELSAQQNVFSRSDGGALWRDNGALPWYYQTWNSNEAPQDIWPEGTRNDVFIGHNGNTTMAVNGAIFTLRNLTMQNSATDARTCNASDGGGISLSGGYTNEGFANQTFNVPIHEDGSNVRFSIAGGLTTFSRDFNLNSNTATFAGAGNAALGRTVSGTGGSISKTGAGNLNLSGNNTYTGTLHIDSAIPEPRAALLGGIGVLLLLRRRR